MNCGWDLISFVQGMLALRREATEISHEDFVEGIAQVQAKKKAQLDYYT